MTRTLHAVQPSECARARADASARLDGELAELDAARLRAHLRGCTDCRVFAEEIERAAVLLRGAALEPAAIGSCASVRPPVASRVAVAVAVAAVALAAAATASRAPTSSRQFVRPGAFAQLSADRIPPTLRGLRRRPASFRAT